jgi:hypothetical protein
LKHVISYASTKRQKWFKHLMNDQTSLEQFNKNTKNKYI